MCSDSALYTYAQGSIFFSLGFDCNVHRIVVTRSDFNIYIHTGMRVYRVMLGELLHWDPKWVPFFALQLDKEERVAPDCNRSYCEDSFSGYSGSV